MKQRSCKAQAVGSSPTSGSFTGSVRKAYDFCALLASDLGAVGASVACLSSLRPRVRLEA